MKFPHFFQFDSQTCGPTCVKIVSQFYGKSYPLSYLVQMSNTDRDGTTLLSISETAEKIGFRTTGAKIRFSSLENCTMPLIAHWNQKHFVVVYKVKKKKIYVSDPAAGLLTYTKQEFLKCWATVDHDTGIILNLETTPHFANTNAFKPNETLYDFKFFLKYFYHYKGLLAQLILGLLLGSLLQLIFPFLTQNIVDVGIKNNNLNFIVIVLLAQLMLFLGRASIDIIRSWILMHMSGRITLSLMSDFFIKLMKLPIRYFDAKSTGDIMQRISDNLRIESFFSATLLNILFSGFNFLMFSVILLIYDHKIFLLFSAGTIAYFAWVVFFLRRRAKLDYKRFQQGGFNHSKTVELIQGMQEIKLHNAERQKRWEWERTQLKMFKINLKGLALSQTQNSGAAFINELKNILITFFCAKLVLDGEITLGIMLSISYIIGQLNAPVSDFIKFIQHWQDAKLSILRLREIHGKDDEHPAYSSGKAPEIINQGISLRNVFFKYSNNESAPTILSNIDVVIPPKKITAIVGASGSGKTTLLKILLKFYEPSAGKINVGDNDLSQISPAIWRSKCGTVMQEGFIFSDTIANNIAIGCDSVDMDRLRYAVELANIKEFIEKLPLGYNTHIGAEGIGLSTGQKQRLLIARAVYKNPEYLFFDEATSALDSNNERVIMNNLQSFFKEKTVVIIAHRLSTVKNADQILVLENGQVIERDSHERLTKKKGAYYELVKNQLELGN